MSCIVPALNTISPWIPAYRIKEASDYCFTIYKKILPQISSRLMGGTKKTINTPKFHGNILLCWLTLARKMGRGF